MRNCTLIVNFLGCLRLLGSSIKIWDMMLGPWNIRYFSFFMKHSSSCDKIFKTEASDVFRPFGRLVYRFGRPKNTFQVFFFQLYFNKFVEVAINDFTMHLIISKWHWIQKCRQTRKTMWQRDRSEKRNFQRKCFH